VKSGMPRQSLSRPLVSVHLSVSALDLSVLRPWLLVLALVAAAACHRVKPDAPTLAPEPAPAPEALPSLVSLPITYDFSAAVADLNAKVPDHMGDINSGWIEDPPGNRAKYKYEIWRNPFSLTVAPDSLQLATVIEYSAKGGYDPPVAPMVTGSCGVGEPRRRVAVGVTTTATLAPSWTLQSSTTLTRLEALNRCTVTIFNVDVTDKILGRARALLSGELGRVDTALAALDVRSPAAQAWAKLQEPLQLAPDAWLMVNPDEVHFSGIGGDGTTLRTVVGLRGAPRVVYGARPASTTAPLPSPGVPPAGLPGFNVTLVAAIPHEAASAEIRSTLRGRRLVRGKRHIEVTDARVYGVGSNVAVLEVAFKGSAKGRAFFTGHPAYDPATGRLSVADLEFDLETKNVLLKAADWLYHSDVRDVIRAQATWDARPAVQGAHDALQKALNADLGNGIALTGSVSAVTPVGVWVSPSEVWLLIRAEGTASVANTGGTRN
jgi:hypothetical protein